MSDTVNRCITGRFQCIKGNFPFFKPKYILESQLITFEPSCFKTSTSYIKKTTYCIQYPWCNCSCRCYMLTE